MTVDELLARMTAQELAEWSYIFAKEEQVGQLTRGGVDHEVASRIAFESKDEDE